MDYKVEQNEAKDVEGVAPMMVHKAELPTLSVRMHIRQRASEYVERAFFSHCVYLTGLLGTQSHIALPGVVTEKACTCSRFCT